MSIIKFRKVPELFSSRKFRIARTEQLWFWHGLARPAVAKHAGHEFQLHSVQLVRNLCRRQHAAVRTEPRRRGSASS